MNKEELFDEIQRQMSERELLIERLHSLNEKIEQMCSELEQAVENFK